MTENGTGTDTPQNTEASGAITSREATRKNPSQGKFKSGVNKKGVMKIDVNKHGIRRETNMQPKVKRTGRKKV